MASQLYGTAPPLSIILDSESARKWQYALAEEATMGEVIGERDEYELAGKRAVIPLRGWRWLVALLTGRPRWEAVHVPPGSCVWCAIERRGVEDSEGVSIVRFP